MANDNQPMIHLPPPFPYFNRAYANVYANISVATLSVPAPSNQQHRSPWSGLRNRKLLENSTADFGQPSAKYGAIGSGPLKPPIPAKTIKFAKGPIIYLGTKDNIWAPTDESSASSSSSSSSKVTFEPGLQLPTRLSPEQKAHSKARARAMVDDEADTSMKMMLAMALYEYSATRAYRLWLTEGVDDGELGDDEKTDGEGEEDWETDGELGDDEKSDGEVDEDWEMV